MVRPEFKYLHARIICGPAEKNRLSDTRFHGEIISTLISIKEPDISATLRTVIDTMQQQGRFLVAALVVAQIEGDPDTDPTQFDYCVGAYTELDTGMKNYHASNHIIELIKCKWTT